MKTWLVLDVHYLCHRAFHSMGNLSHGSRATGVVFGFLKTITSLKDEFQTDRFAFCFEHPHLFRRDVFPAYKRRRHSVERTQEEKAAYESLVIQINELRLRYLPKIGFKNIFSFRGMESDDVMAQIARSSPADEVILVTADTDLFQSLRKNVSIYSPQKKKLISKKWFIRQYGIRPKQWATVKAIAGCSSDEVPGIRGVGELTALRHLRGELGKTTKAYQAITSSDGWRIVLRNLPLVELPYEGCPQPHLVEDKISRAGWMEVCGTLGMKSMIGRI